MSVKIRLSRGGTKKRPYYYIVVANSTSPRDGRYIEQIGTHNPMLPKDNADRVKLDVERAKHWLSVGAQPTDRVMRFLDAAGLVKRTASQQSRQGQAEEEAPGARGRPGRSGRQEGRGRRGQAAARPYSVIPACGMRRCEAGVVVRSQAVASPRPHRRGARHPRRGADPRLHGGAGGHRRLRAAVRRRPARSFEIASRARDAQGRGGAHRRHRRPHRGRGAEGHRALRRLASGCRQRPRASSTMPT